MSYITLWTITVPASLVTGLLAVLGDWAYPITAFQKNVQPRPIVGYCFLACAYLEGKLCNHVLGDCRFLPIKRPVL